MVIKGHPLIKLVVALCATVATLSACGSDGGATITADEVAQQEAQQETQKDSEPDAQQEEPQRADQEQDEAPAASTATNADLDAYVASGEKALREMFGDSFKKIYSSINIVPVYPSGIEYDYTYRTPTDPALAGPQLDKQAPTLRTQARTVVFPEMESLGFASPSVTYTYRNPDGSVVWTRTFS